MLSIIIPTLKSNKKYLDLCIESLSENTTGDFKILVEENGKDTDYAPGQWGAVNRGLAKVDTDWTMVVNDDMYFPQGWDRYIDYSYDCFSPNWIEPPEVGSAPPFLKLNAGNTLETFNKEEVDKFALNNEDLSVENGFNLGFIIKTDLFRKIEGFDEMYDPYGSNGDSDFQYKLEIAGVTPKRNRSMLIYHFGSKSESFTPDKQSYWQKNYEYFTEKWGIKRADSPDIWYHNLKIDKDQLKYKPDWSTYV